MTGGRGQTITDAAGRLAAERERRWRPGARTAGLASALAAAWLVLPPGTAGAAGVGRAGPAAAGPGGTVLAWGANVYGELGDGTTTERSTPAPVKLPPGFHYGTVRAQLFSVALTTSGRVYAWGDNSSGQLGDGTTKDRLKPVRVQLPRGTTATAVRAGTDFVLALTSTGKLLAWGDNRTGELGNGSTKNRLKPAAVRLPRGVRITAISAGYDSGLALTTAGRLLSWGGNGAGQLGDGTRKRRLAPGPVRLPAHTKVTSIAAGAGVAFAATSTGRLLAWGANGQGTLGNGTTTSRSLPGPVRLPTGTKVVAATAGQFQVLALTAGGQVLAWGNNQAGQLGDGTTTDRHVPVRVRLPKGTKIRALAAGKYFSFALTAAGRILAWGDNTDGQLGTDFDSLHQSDVPVRVKLPAGFTPTAIGAGTSASTALAIGRQLRK